QFFLIVLVIFEFIKSFQNFGKIKLKPTTIFTLSFVGLILLGSAILMLPGLNTKGEWMNYFDALFTSASASCVTGLIVVDTATYFNVKGQLFLLFLMQIGALGIVT